MGCPRELGDSKDGDVIVLPHYQFPSAFPIVVGPCLICRQSVKAKKRPDVLYKPLKIQVCYCDTNLHHKENQTLICWEDHIIEILS